MSFGPRPKPEETANAADVPRRGRRIAFRVIAIVMAVAAAAFGLLTAVFGILDEGQRQHAFHNAVVATLLLVLSAPPVIAAARAPESSIRPLTHLAVVGIAGLITMALSLSLDPFTFPFVVLVGVLWLLRPSRERAVPSGKPDWILLVLVLVAAVPLVLYALGQAELQRVDASSEHAEFYHWVETSFFVVAALLLGLLAALRPAAYRLSAWTAGIAMIVLGAASLAFRGYASTVDVPWAWAALLGGFVFVVVAERNR
jgi:hypothetical protein